MRADPVVTFLVILAIGVAAGFIFQRFAGPSWLSRQIAGETRGLVTSALVGIAGSFTGYHIAGLLGLTGPVVPFVIAAAGAAAVLWGWRMIR